MNSLKASGDALRKEVQRNRIAKITAIVAPLLIAAVVILLQQQLRTSDALRQSEQEAIEQRMLLQSVLSAHQDIETGARGYVITGQDPYLVPYRQGLASLQAIWPRLDVMYADDPEEAAIIAALHATSRSKRAITQQTIDIRRNGDANGAKANVATGRGKLTMDQLRALTARLLDHQNARLAVTARRNEAALAGLRTGMFVVLGVLMALLVASWIALQNLLRLRDEALARVEDLSLRREAVLENAVDGIITLNPSGSIESVNAATLRLFGYDRSSLHRRDVGMLFAHQPAIGVVAEQLRSLDLENRSTGVSQEILGLRADGTTVATEVGVSAMRLNEGLRYVAIVRDVTERKRVEQLKNDFVSTVSHELRTPLTSIAGALGLLEGGAAGGLDDRARRLITIAHNNADRLVRLINDILDIEKIESGKMPFDNREVDLKAAIAAAIEENRGYASQHKASIAFAAPMTPMLVMADRDRLSQVLANLLSNAAKYSPEGGVIDVSLRKLGTWYRITVADQGQGIPAEFRERIFQRFAQADSSTTREKGGTGLGLAIVREIVERLDGKVSFESEPGEGTRFHIDLPALNVKSVSAPMHRAPSQSEPALLVCGNGAGTVFSDALRRAGYDVTFVRDEALLREALGARAYDGIVVDMGLEDGAGIEVIRLCREEPRNAATPVLALGGEKRSGDLEGDAALVMDWLTKPVDMNRLLGSLTAVDDGTPGHKPRVLHVEDDADVVRLVAEALAGRADVVAAEGLAAARSALSSIRFDLAIVDLALADGNGIEILSDLYRRADGSPLPVIIFSAQDADPETASLVDAYLTKARTPIASLVSLVDSLVAGPKRSHAA